MHPGRGELQGQGHSVEPEADLRHGLHVRRRQPKARGRFGSPLHEQPYGGEAAHLLQARQPTRIGQAEGRHSEGAFPVAAQRLPAGREHEDVRAASQDLRGQRGTRVDEVLAVVQHQQHRPSRELCDQRLPAPAGLGELHPQGCGDRLGHEMRFRQPGEVHEPRPVPEVVAPPGRHGEREPGLAAAAGPGEGQQPAPPEQPVHLGHFAFPADQGCRRCGQIVPSGPRPLLVLLLDGVGQQLTVEAACLRVGVGAGVPVQPVPQLLVERLPASPGVGEDPHQRPVTGLVQRVLGHQGAQDVDGLGRVVSVFQCLAEPQPECGAPCLQRHGRLAHPGLVTVLGQQIGSGQGERRTVVRGPAAVRGPPGHLVERVEIDPHTAVGAEQHQVVPENDDVARRAGGGQRTPHGVQHLVQVVRRGRPVEVRPQQVVEPLPVQLVAR